MTTEPTNTGRARNRLGWRRAGFAVTAVLVAAAVVLTVAGHQARRTPAPARSPVGGAPAGSPPAMPVVGAPPAATPTTAGAVAAAAWIVENEPLLVSVDQSQAVRMVDSWASATARQSLEARFVAVRTAFDQTAGGPYRFEVAVLAQRATEHGVGQVAVDAWCSEVIFARGEPSYATYVTERLGLVWQSSAWRLASMSDTPGPSVALASDAPATPAAEAAASLAGFSPLPEAAQVGTQTEGGQ